MRKKGGEGGATVEDTILYDLSSHVCCDGLCVSRLCLKLVCEVSVWSETMASHGAHTHTHRLEVTQNSDRAGCDWTQNA